MTTVEKISGCRVKLSFAVPAEQFENAMNKAYLQNRGKINVPGFRKGKAPRHIIEQMYGKYVFVEDALDVVFPEVYSAAIEENELRPVGQPSMVDMGEYKRGEEMTFAIEVDVRPEVELGEYKGLSVEVEPKHEVEDEEVDERIQQELKDAARTIDVTDRTVDYNDTVNLDYAGSVDGVAFQGGTAQGQTLVIGSGQFIPGFEEQMVGMAIGEERDLQVKFPEQYHSEELAGKDAVFHVKVNSITYTEVPELDDDFAQDKGFDTVDEYRADVRAQLEKRAQRNYDVTVENALIEAAAANATVEIPESMIQEQVSYILRDMEYRMMMQGMNMDMFLQYTGQTREQLAAQYHDQGEQRCKIELTLEAIRKAEAVEPTEEAVDAQIAQQAERMGREVEEFRASLTDEQRSYLTDTAAIQMVCDLLKAGATVTEKVAEEAPAEETAAEETDAE
ncbi:MAG: trigger factor [Clostridia bacterium]|nr:trigger factor [Clostridia bacterium]